MGLPFTCPSGSSWPSKSSWKKATKLAKMRGKHDDRKRKEKEDKRERRERYLAEELAGGRDVLEEEREREERRDVAGIAEKAERLASARKAKAAGTFGICIDCSFEARMTTKERTSLARQIQHSYSFNRRDPSPVLLTVADLEKGGECRGRLEKQGGYPAEWRLFEERSLADFEKGSLVYLTADSPNTLLTALDSTKTYVIVGIVDRNRLHLATLTRAELSRNPSRQASHRRDTEDVVDEGTDCEPRGGDTGEGEGGRVGEGDLGHASEEEGGGRGQGEGRGGGGGRGGRREKRGGGGGGGR